MGLIDCPGGSYSLPWKIAIISSESFSPSMRSRFKSERLKAMSGNRLVDSHKASLDIQSEMSMLYGGKASKGDSRYSVKQGETGKVKFKMLH